MKSRLLFALFIAQSLFCFGQSNFSFGFMGGLGYSGWGKTLPDESPKASYTPTKAKALGIFASYKLPYRLRATTEATFLQSGSLYRNEASVSSPFVGATSSPAEVTYKVSRIYAPVRISYDILKTRVTPFVSWGFGPSFVQRASRSHRDDLSPNEQSEDLNLEVSYNNQLRLAFPMSSSIGIRVFERLTLEASLILGKKFYYRFQADETVCYEGCAKPELSYNNRMILFAAAYNILP
ncbi:MULTISPECIES: hypothetical protein [unclassified Imperialibacter]|uniref:hypothetical protein n=1 Tax=unclassified Imperialibacter TaxID=2629706 RepID=UPI001253AFED|nr:MULTISPECIES: hypothetical protein [unclassified Imperialibacter]CAD5250640.1 exported hypothetical protein [Imperialibacter sp. 75]CAD5286235.1 exported hypothetical protein [Imperialibacter sp. 89]VVT05385.1 exported hypothetical protein [Imperialibacter sp. EC-SDR9]